LFHMNKKLNQIANLDLFDAEQFSAQGLLRNNRTINKLKPCAL